MSPSNPNVNTAILVASRNSALTAYINTVLGDPFHIAITTQSTDLMTAIERHCPLLVMLDPDLFDSSLQNIITEKFAHLASVRVIILEDEQNNPVDQLALFKSGAHGFLSHTISPALLLKAAHAVCGGEIWVPRQLIAQLVGELARDTSTGAYTLNFNGNQSIEHLTPRELQVAEMVHGGGNNKSIARSLDISERTVKAHLSAIFRKLDVENRLHLALYFSQLK